VPRLLQRRNQLMPGASLLVSSSPFLITFIIVAIIAIRKLLPFLTGHSAKEPSHHHSSTNATTFFYQYGHFGRLLQTMSPKHITALTFSTTIALSAVLAELLLCEISDIWNLEARGIALKITLLLLLVILILVSPALEIHSAISAAGWTFTGKVRTLRRLAWAFAASCLSLWLLAFWYIGGGSGGSQPLGSVLSLQGFMQGCLGRLGVIGISLMASLAGFAAVSTIWQTFGSKTRLVSV
jgi:hypothetical protein